MDLYSFYGFAGTILNVNLEIAEFEPRLVVRMVGEEVAVVDARTFSHSITTDGTIHVGVTSGLRSAFGAYLLTVSQEGGTAAPEGAKPIQWGGSGANSRDANVFGGYGLIGETWDLTVTSPLSKPLLTIVTPDGNAHYPVNGRVVTTIKQEGILTVSVTGATGRYTIDGWVSPPQ